MKTLFSFCKKTNIYRFKEKLLVIDKKNDNSTLTYVIILKYLLLENKK